jgi:hypothetical protein
VIADGASPIAHRARLTRLLPPSKLGKMRALVAVTCLLGPACSAGDRVEHDSDAATLRRDAPVDAPRDAPLDARRDSGPPYAWEDVMFEYLPDRIDACGTFGVRISALNTGTESWPPFFTRLERWYGDTPLQVELPEARPGERGWFVGTPQAGEPGSYSTWYMTDQADHTLGPRTPSVVLDIVVPDGGCPEIDAGPSP